MQLPPATPAEDASAALVRAHQLGFACLSLRTELLICLTGDGMHFIDAEVGAANRVELTNKMLDAALTPMECRLVHNHPEEGSLSGADWRLIRQHPGIRIITAVNSNGSVFRGSLGSGSDALERYVDADMGDLSAQVGDAVEALMWKDFEEMLRDRSANEGPELLIDALKWAWSHLVNERLHDLGHVLYEAALSQKDAEILSHSAFAKYVDAGRARVTASIR